MQFITRQGEDFVRWFGKNSENAADEFTGKPDFEGYRIWMSPDRNNFTIIGSFDKVDWKVWYLNNAKQSPGSPLPGIWEPTPMPPLTWDEIQHLYALKRDVIKDGVKVGVSGWDTCSNYVDPVTGDTIIGRPIDPNRFNAATAINITAQPGFDGTSCNPDIAKTAIRVRFCNSSSHNNNFADTVFYF